MSESAPASSDSSVFIVGGGPVGLAAALLLDRFGIDCVLVERNATTLRVPKARLLSVRSFELFRQLGIEQRVRAQAKPESVLAVVESLTGREYGRSRPEPDLGHSPTWLGIAAQEVVEDELWRAARRASRLRAYFSTEAISFAEDADRMLITTRSADTGERRQWSARYVIAADGASSPTRSLLGIDMIGPDALGAMFTQSWRTDPARLDPRRAFQVGGYYIVSGDPKLPASSNVANDRGNETWLSMFGLGTRKADRERPWSEAATIELIQRQAGLPDLPVDLQAHSVFFFTNQLAQSYRRGRLFLVGDAAHRFSPTGGLGLNTGLGDAHNLAWKLAFVLKGYASESLLKTYEVERRPVARSNADWSSSNASRLERTTMSRSALPPLVTAARSGDPARLAFWLRDFENHTHIAGRALGTVYEEGAVVPDGTASRPFNSRYYTPSDRPGERFPHQWTDLSRSRSTLDWFDRDMALVVGPSGSDWLAAGADAARKLGLPLALHQLPRADPGDGFEMGSSGAVLVRPDGHVAWRIGWLSDDPVTELGGALTALFPPAG